MTNDQLENEIRRLSAIFDEGQLPQVLMDFAADCRAAGGLPRPDERSRTVQHMEDGAIAKFREVAKAAAHMLGRPIEECERISREVLVRDPWAEIAIELIAHYAPSEKPPARRPR